MIILAVSLKFYIKIYFDNKLLFHNPYLYSGQNIGPYGSSEHTEADAESVDEGSFKLNSP